MFPPALVDEVIAEAGRTEQRNRALPARVMAYFAIGMALFSEGSYEDVLSQLTDGLSWTSGWEQSYTAPSKSAIFQARARLGSEPLAALFARVLPDDAVDNAKTGMTFVVRRGRGSSPARRGRILPAPLLAPTASRCRPG